MWGWAALALSLLPAAAGAVPDKKNCGTVVAEANNDISSFNPLYANSLGDQRAAQLLFQPLVWVDRHGVVNPARSIAETITVSADTTRYVLTLRPWHWSDGTQVSAADIVYEWRMIAALGINYPGYGSGGIPMQIKSVIALDPMHVAIVLTGPVNPTWFIDNGLAQLTPLPAHAWARLSLADLYQMQSEPAFFTVVDGPMRVARLDVGLDAVFTPNPRYDGPPPHLQRLVLSFVHGDGAALQQVEAGDLDFAPVPLQLYRGVHDLHGVHLELLSPVSFFYFLILNFQNPHVAFFRDVRVRQAIADAIDQKAIISLVFHGFGDELHTAIPPVAANMLAPALANGAGPAGYNPDKAQALLAAAGYKAGPDGVLAKGAEKLAFTALMSSGGGEETEMMVFLQAQLRAVGIDMRLRQLEFNDILQLLNNEPGNWEAAQLGTYPSLYPSGEGLFQTGAGGNQGGYADPEMDRLIAASISKPGLAGLYDYEIYTASQQPVIFLATEKHLELVSDRIHGVDGFSDGALLAPDSLVCSEN